MRDSIFISYSHADRPALDELLKLHPVEGQAIRLMFWDDTQIRPSARWRGEIEEALGTCAAAVLLLSRSFFASEFITKEELPALLGAAARSEIRIFPVILTECDHALVTATYQTVNNPARPLVSLDETGRRAVAERLAVMLRDVDAEVTDEQHIAAEMRRLQNDLVQTPAVMGILDKISRARVDPAFAGNERMLENTLVFLEGQRCQAAATWLMEEMNRTGLSPFRSKAIVRSMEDIARSEEKALRRATELTVEFRDDALALLKMAKEQTPGGG